VVAFGIIFNQFIDEHYHKFTLRDEHLVQIPILAMGESLLDLLTFPDFSAISNPKLWEIAIALTIVASLESILSVEAVDKLDPYKRKTPMNRELIAQGVGNAVCGLIGGLPITAVIVRGSANVNAGAKTKVSAIVHGLCLFLSVIFIPNLLNTIPLASLAGILLFTGYKLAKISLFKEMWRNGKSQFIPFFVTLVAIYFTDLLKGIAVGLLITSIIILRRNMKNSFTVDRLFENNKKIVTINLSQEVSYLNKGSLQTKLENIPNGSKVIIDGTNSVYIDYDVSEYIGEFKISAPLRDIEVELIGIKEVSQSSNGH
jgi:MFS superfamily sulfate permease-like transporter